MTKIQDIFKLFYEDYCAKYGHHASLHKVANAIINCKTGGLGYNISTCNDCGHEDVHNNSCRNRHCPSCQAIPKELWIDARKSEVLDSPYFHAVFTIPHELNPIMYTNQKLLYSLFYKVVAETIDELASDKKHLGAKTGFIQILHTWGQNLSYHVHMHVIVLGGGLTHINEFKKAGKKFFLPVRAMSKLFRGKFLCNLRKLYKEDKLEFSNSISYFKNSHNWDQFIDSLFKKEWVPYIKETFNGANNVIEYLGRYTHRIANSNSRIVAVSDAHVTFNYRDYADDNKTKEMTLDGVEFLRRFLMHVLPKGFVKIRNFGILSNRTKNAKLNQIRKILGEIPFVSKLKGLTMAEVIMELYGVNLRLCPACNSPDYVSMNSYHRRV
ncbi:MAG: IS91 family transposase [Dysgonamonadaceae bacterium]|nr:IS91 family transposase [Dysgonamonadaceae bacterium]